MSLYTFLADDDPTLICPVLPHRHNLRVPQRLPRPVPVQDLRQFFAVIDDVRDRAMFVLTLAPALRASASAGVLRCGLRISEAVSLHLTDLYLDESPPRLLIRGKGSKERAARFASPRRPSRLYEPTWLNVPTPPAANWRTGYEHLKLCCRTL